jgi:hypothetical protein
MKNPSYQTVSWHFIWLVCQRRLNFLLHIFFRTAVNGNGFFKQLTQFVLKSLKNIGFRVARIVGGYASTNV